MNGANITILLLTLLIVFSTSQVKKQPRIPRCLCPKVQSGGRIPYRDLKSVWHLTPRPHCSKTEVIIRLKNGRQLCLDPKEPSVKILVERSIKRTQESKQDVGNTTQSL
ncbi:C-X-C motif chemokine 19 [Esox lucius]|uniref:C-X-C motif chemokine 19 n=1 Tax=Esox lucius TaxID=8010 RepID=UPI001476CBA3|nr:C-X-C motif chemokine 19 [Esox lucius]